MKIFQTFFLILVFNFSVFGQISLDNLNIIILEKILLRKDASFADETLSKYGFILVEREYFDNPILPFDTYDFAYEYDKDEGESSVWIQYHLRDILTGKLQSTTDTSWYYEHEYYDSGKNMIRLYIYDTDLYDNLTKYIKNNYTKSGSEYFERINAFQYYYENNIFEYVFYKNTEISMIRILYGNEEERNYLDSVEQVWHKMRSLNNIKEKD
jgi:hypothetical protein